MKIEDKTLIKSHILSASPTIIEAGCSDGGDTLELSNLFPESVIHSFEPVFDLYEIAKKRVGNRPNVFLHNMALSDTTGHKLLNISDRHGEIFGSSSILKPQDHLTFHPEITFKKSVGVKSINLDEFVESKNITKIDLMWLDMQGYESTVLSASPKSMAMMNAIYTEVSFMEMYHGGMLYPEYKSFLEKNGLTLINLDSAYADMGNAFFVRK